MKYSETVIQAFLLYDKASDIAAATGKSLRTIANYKKSAELQAILQERRAEYVRTALYKMQATINETTDTLLSIIQDNEVAAQTRVNAINVFFTQCREWTAAVDILERLQRLEQDINAEKCNI